MNSNEFLMRENLSPNSIINVIKIDSNVHSDKLTISMINQPNPNSSNNSVIFDIIKGAKDNRKKITNLQSKYTKMILKI